MFLNASYCVAFSQTIKTGIKSVQFVHNLKVPAFAICLWISGLCAETDI